jgi:hypothetical protein
MPVPSSLTTTRLSREPINEQTGQDILTALGGTAGSISAGIGAKADTAATTDTGTFSLIALVKRLLAKITAFLTSDGAAVVTVGASLPVRVTLTASATPNYSTGDSLGGKIVLANAVRVAGGASRLENLLITDNSNQKPSGYIYIFDSDPAVATLTDNAAAVFSTDRSKIIARIDVSAADYITTGTQAVADIPYAGRLLKSAATTSLWAGWVLLADGINLADAGDIEVLFNFSAAS